MKGLKHPEYVPWLMTVTMVTAAIATEVSIETKEASHVTDRHFLSFTIDSSIFSMPERWERFDYR